MYVCMYVCMHVCTTVRMDVLPAQTCLTNAKERWEETQREKKIPSKKSIEMTCNGKKGIIKFGLFGRICLVFVEDAGGYHATRPSKFELMNCHMVQAPLTGHTRHWQGHVHNYDLFISLPSRHPIRQSGLRAVDRSGWRANIPYSIRTHNSTTSKLSSVIYQGGAPF